VWSDLVGIGVGIGIGIGQNDLRFRPEYGPRGISGVGRAKSIPIPIPIPIPTRRQRPQRYAGANFGSVTSSLMSSNTTRTGMPMRMSCGAPPTKLETILAPSASFTITTA